MIKSIALIAGLALVPAAAIAQTTQAPVNAPNNTRPTNTAPVPSPSGATVSPTPAPGVSQNPAGGTIGAPVNTPASPGGTVPAQPAPSGTPNPAGSGASSTKP
ncbi:hypothetical protein [Bosea sp. AAP35]|uniref:hypothetical protein n=1 Tax=Bosea sp. AAP35 TaxID=1523417 RepID=UPI000AB96A30|nr:hypothetical protein [Bosea sp. AAP35]